MTTPACSPRSRVLNALLVSSVLCFSWLTSIAAEAKRSFDIPAGKAESTLKQFADQAGTQFFFSAEKVNGTRTKAIKGEMTPSEALETMLAKTELVAVQDEKTGAYTVRREASVEKAEKNAQRVALGKSSDRPKNQKNETKDGVLELEKIEVTGSRIRSLVGEQGVQPVLTVTSRDIERFGITSLGDVFRFIPQISGFELGQVVYASSIGGNSPAADVASTRISATLRGAPAGGTLLLINGRRTSKTGQGSVGVSGGGAYDLSGIPLSAVERIEVLLDGASSVYGADAVGGVINVILKKNYRGTELRLGYENTFDSDVGVRTASITHGFAAGKVSGMLTASYEDANAMMWRDRSFLATFDRRSVGGSDLRGTSSIGGLGRIRVTSGTLPGLGVSQAAIPAGSQGSNVSVQDYANSGPIPGVLDLGTYAQYSTPYRRVSLAGNFEYRLNSTLTVFGEARWGHSQNISFNTPLGATNITLPIGAPGNPFGVPIIVDKIFFDQPLPVRRAETRNHGGTFGLRWQVTDWQYELAVNSTRSKADLAGDAGGGLSAARVNAAFAAGSAPVLAYDSTVGIPRNTPGVLQALTVPPNGGEVDETWTYSGLADGPLFHLPAGEVKAALGAEYSEEYVDFPVASLNVSLRSKNRYATAAYVEVRVPLLGAKQAIPLVQQVEVSGAVRGNSYSDFAAATTTRWGIVYRPVTWILLRASHGQGYKVPTLNQLYRPDTLGLSFPSSSVVDALRGNTGVPSAIFFNLKGNAALLPEHSKNTSAGLVLEIPALKQLSLSVDYFDTDYIDRVGSILLTDRIILFPDTVRRGPNLPSDLPGWAGPITGYDDIPINTASERIAGYDFGVKFSHPLAGGEILVNASASKTTLHTVKSAANQPPSILSTPRSLPLRINGSVFWSRGSYDLGVMCTYRDQLRSTTTAALGIPSSIRWDCTIGFDLSRGDWIPSGWPHRILADTRLSVTVFNFLDRKPALVPVNYLPDNTIVDSRMRRFALNLVKKF